jgi:hypothetical protein
MERLSTKEKGMRRVFGLSLVLLALSTGSSCGAGGPDNTTKEIIAAMNQMASIMQTIRDESSARAALPKLATAADHAGELRRQLDSYNLSSADKKRLQAKFQKDSDEARTRMTLASLQAMKKAPKKRPQIIAVLKRAIKGKS